MDRSSNDTPELDRVHRKFHWRYESNEICVTAFMCRILLYVKCGWLRNKMQHSQATFV